MQFSYLDCASVLTFDPQYDAVHSRVTEPIGSLALVCASVRAWEGRSVEQSRNKQQPAPPFLPGIYPHLISPLNISSPDMLEKTIFPLRGWVAPAGS